VRARHRSEDQDDREQARRGGRGVFQQLHTHVEVVRALRDDIAGRVDALIAELDG
jgi:hypothetical protein